MPWRGTWDENIFDKDIVSLTNYYNNQGYRDFYIVNKKIYIPKGRKNYVLELDVSVDSGF